MKKWLLLCIFLLPVIVTSLVHAEGKVSVELKCISSDEESLNSVRSDIEVSEDAQLVIGVRNNTESNQRMYYRLHRLVKGMIPGLESFYFPQVVREGDVEPGKANSMKIDVVADKYRLELFSNQPDCIGCGTVEVIKK